MRFAENGARYTSIYSGDQTGHNATVRHVWKTYVCICVIPYRRKKLTLPCFFCLGWLHDQGRCAKYRLYTRELTLVAKWGKSTEWHIRNICHFVLALQSNTYRRSTWWTSMFTQKHEMWKMTLKPNVQYVNDVYGNGLTFIGWCLLLTRHGGHYWLMVVKIHMDLPCDG